MARSILPQSIRHSYPHYEFGAPGRIVVLLGDGTGGFGGVDEFPFGPAVVAGQPMPEDIAVGDVDEDGRPDLVAGSTGFPALVSVLLNGRCGPGGKGLHVSAGRGRVSLSWIGGKAQTGYVIARIADGRTMFLPGPGMALPATATSYTDPASVLDATNCYQLFAIGALGVLEWTTESHGSDPSRSQPQGSVSFRSSDTPSWLPTPPKR